MNCPRCGTPLEKSYYNKIINFHCPHCNGQAVTLSGLRSLGVDPDNLAAIWQSANAGKLGTLLNCPECGKPMRVVKLDNGNNICYIDSCISCHVIWFDFGELENIPVIQFPCPQPPPKVSPVPVDKFTASSGNDSFEIPSVLDHLGIDRTWCSIALQLLLKLFFRI